MVIFLLFLLHHRELDMKFSSIALIAMKLGSDIHGSIDTDNDGKLMSLILKRRCLNKWTWTCISMARFQSTDRSERFTTLVTFTNPHAHSYTDGGG